MTSKFSPDELIAKMKTNKSSKKPPVKVSPVFEEVKFPDVRDKAVRGKFVSDASLVIPQRIVQACLWYGKNFSERYVSLPVLHWLVYGGKGLKKLNSPDIKRFRNHLTFAKKIMADEHSLLLRTTRGFMAVIKNQTAIAILVWPANFREAKRVAEKSARNIALTGNPKDWKGTPTTQPVVDGIRAGLSIIHSITASGRNLILPPHIKETVA
jgi:hypothetical protein